MTVSSPSKPHLPQAPSSSLGRAERAAAPAVRSPWPRAIYRGWVFLLGFVVVLTVIELIARCSA